MMIEGLIAGLAILSIFAHLLIADPTYDKLPLYLTIVLGGVPLVFGLLRKAWNREFGSDLLAGISIVTATVLGEYLAAVLVVLMLSGGEALERFAVSRASSALQALAARLPSKASRKRADGSIEEIDLVEISVGDRLVVSPHQICPVDGVVVEGHGRMDEAYLTGEPFEIAKAPGSLVLSGAINGASALLIKATKLPVDSRYAKIMQVMKAAEEKRPSIRRLGDTLGAWYTPLALLIAVAAWIMSGEVIRFLAVLVVATPCPLLISIPIVIIGSVSLAAKRGIIIRDPAALEVVDHCRTMILDKTGTLTYGKPTLTGETVFGDFKRERVLQLVASLERYSKHPLAIAVLNKNGNAPLLEASEVHEPPGQGLAGVVDGRGVLVTHRGRLSKTDPELFKQLPAGAGGLECVILIDGALAAVYQFHDGARADSRPFIEHLASLHGINRVLLVSGDRHQEVSYLAEQVGIKEIYAAQSPEDKVRIVREETAKSKTIFVGDGINDAPALATATVGLAFGPNSDVTSEAARAVIMEGSLARIDEFLHISKRMRAIALQSAVGGMALSVAGMVVAAMGLLPPVAGALTQEIIDVLSIVNALRAAVAPASLKDY